MGEVTIDSIQIEIESSSTNAAKGIDALAGSLERLKKNGSFKTVSTNLNNLSAALKNLPNVHNLKVLARYQGLLVVLLNCQRLLNRSQTQILRRLRHRFKGLLIPLHPSPILRRAVLAQW